MGIQFEKLKKEFDRLSHTGKTGSGKGKQKYFFKVGLTYSYSIILLINVIVKLVKKNGLIKGNGRRSIISNPIVADQKGLDKQLRPRSEEAV